MTNLPRPVRRVPARAARRAPRRAPARADMARRARHRSRGQSLAEFALTVPMVLLMILFGLDFGRVFLGWVALNSATREAANYAAMNPTAWTIPYNLIVRRGIRAARRDRGVEHQLPPRVADPRPHVSRWQGNRRAGACLAHLPVRPDHPVHRPDHRQPDPGERLLGVPGSVRASSRASRSRLRARRRPARQSQAPRPPPARRRRRRRRQRAPPPRRRLRHPRRPPPQRRPRPRRCAPS